MADSLYDALGVARDASEEEIKRAHRAGVRRTHPDAGGDPEAFHRVQKAYGILSDQRTRARYDATGVESEADPEQLARSQAMTTVAGMMNAILGNEQIDPRTFDLILGIKEGIREQRRGLETDIAASNRMVTRLQQFERRLKRKKTEGPDHVAVMITSQVEGHRGRIAALEDGLKVMAMAIELVEEYVYKTDPVQQEVYVRGLYSGAGGTSSTWR